MTYNDELNKTIQIAQALTIVADNLQQLGEHYQPLTAVIFHILCGEVLEIQLQCPHCERGFSVQTQQPVNGIDNQLEELREVVEMLQLEIALEGGVNEEEAE